MDGKARLSFNVRRLRTAHGLSQEQLAVDARVSAPYISRIEMGKGNPTVDILDRLAKTLDVSVDRLLVAPPKGSPAPDPLPAGRKPKQAKHVPRR